MNKDILDKTCIFMGSNNVGKSHTMLHVANILTKMGKSVLIIDTTTTQSMYSYFNYNDDLEDGTSLNNLNPIIRNEIEILVNNPLKHKSIDFSNIKKMNLRKYDFILIESDGSITKELISNVKHLFIVQNSSKYSLSQNVELLKNINSEINSKNVTFIFNQLISEAMDLPYIYNILIEKLDNKFTLINNKDIEIPYDVDDIVENSKNQIRGKISLKKYSTEFKDALIEIVNIITPFTDKEFKKLKIN